MAWRITNKGQLDSVNFSFPGDHVNLAAAQR
jgi:hypothetical protein